MACAAVVAAGTWATEPAILAFTAIGQVPLVAALGPWPVSVLAAEDLVNRKVAAVRRSGAGRGGQIDRHDRACLAPRRGMAGAVPGTERRGLRVPAPDTCAVVSTYPVPVRSWARRPSPAARLARRGLVGGRAGAAGRRREAGAAVPVMVCGRNQASPTR
jgi:hypothetical protein